MARRNEEAVVEGEDDFEGILSLWREGHSSRQIGEGQGMDEAEV